MEGIIGRHQPKLGVTLWWDDPEDAKLDDVGRE